MSCLSMARPSMPRELPSLSLSLSSLSSYLSLSSFLFLFLSLSLSKLISFFFSIWSTNQLLPRHPVSRISHECNEPARIFHFLPPSLTKFILFSLHAFFVFFLPILPFPFSSSYSAVRFNQKYLTVFLFLFCFFSIIIKLIGTSFILFLFFFPQMQLFF